MGQWTESQQNIIARATGLVARDVLFGAGATSQTGEHLHQLRRLELYPFRFRDPVSGKWIKERYVAERHEIEKRHAPGEWEIIGPPEIRQPDEERSYFSPWANRQSSKTPVADSPGNKPPPEKDPPSKEPPIKEPKQTTAACEHEPPLDDMERYLVLLFLRRYVTYCTRRERYAQMNGAAKLHR